MSIISANTLFHFTKKNALLAILETGFRPSYCREQFSLASPGDNTIPDLCYIPMVCFCDIPLSQIEQHVKEYGEFGKGYGIGLSVEWGLENNISPVTYVPVRNTETSQISTSVYTQFQKILSMLAFSIGIPNAGEDPNTTPPYKSLLHKINPDILLLMAYLKPYKGEQNGKPRKFYDEKEWRYLPRTEDLPYNNPMYRRIPDFSELDEKNALGLSIFFEAFSNYYRMPPPIALEVAREHIRKHYLTFEAKDIKYIIVHSEEEISEVIDKIRTLPHKYNETQLQIITSKIMTYKQIQEDF